jgi:diguanylate cyclase (GGDEF)-like protein/PAS domain S-box-containing protein
MNSIAAPIFGLRQFPWLRKHGFAVRLGVCFLSIASITVAVESIEQWRPENSPVWVANGLLLAFLLLAPRWRWPAYLLTGFLALSVRSVLDHARSDEFLLYNALNILEVTVGALLLRRRSTVLPRFTERAYLIRFFGYAVLAGPALAGGILALVFLFWAHPAPPHPFLGWMTADSLGIAIATPAFAAVLQTRFRNTLDWRRNWIYPAILLGITFAAFVQNRVPLIYLIYPLLVLVVVRLGLGYASLFTILAAATAEWLTICGYGPFAAESFISPAMPSLHLQAAVASAIMLVYGISVVLERQKATERRLQETVSLHRLVTENSRDLIVLADFNGGRSYVSSASESMGGWKPEEAAALAGLKMVHPEDQPKAEAAMRELRSGGDGVMIECRVRKRNGEYLWVEAALRVVHDPTTGLPSGVLNIVRDISERKRSEQQLQDAYRAVEALALTDGLTGLANRRRFDQYLATEWRRGMRSRQPLSLLMLDVDLFKAYNDSYGHQRGDSCLKQIAESCMDVVSRSADLVARFGGEEFIVTMPNTESEGAMQVAEEICEAVRSRRLPHNGSPMGVVTISIGCATLVPEFGKHAADLIAIADRALYAAKHNGRNQVCLGYALERRGADAQPRPATVTTA